MSGGVIALFLQQVLQGGVGFQAPALQINLRIEQHLLRCQHHLLAVAQRVLARRLIVELVTDLLQTL
ncbi:hypothetical protein D3C75_1310680 [compost metagenome]